MRVTGDITNVKTSRNPFFILDELLINLAGSCVRNLIEMKSAPFFLSTNLRTPNMPTKTTRLFYQTNDTQYQKPVSHFWMLLTTIQQDTLSYPSDSSSLKKGFICSLTPLHQCAQKCCSTENFKILTTNTREI